MLTFIQAINAQADLWVKVMGGFLWQSTLLVLLASLAAWCLRRSSPVVRYWLWQIVAIKLLIMPFWSLAVPLPSWAQTTPSREPSIPHAPESRPPREFADNSDRVLPKNLPASKHVVAEPTPQRPTWGELWAAMTWQAGLFAAWLAVIVWQLFRLIRQRIWLSKLLRMGVAPDDELARLVAESTTSIGLGRPPKAVCVSGDCPLFVCGLWRPHLVLPISLMSSLGPAERRQVILHELAHIKRRDLIWGWTAEIAQMVYFFHPLVWWAGYRMRLERELACDQLAMAHSGHAPADYAQTLVQVVSHASQQAGAQAAAITAELRGGKDAKQ